MRTRAVVVSSIVFLFAPLPAAAQRVAVHQGFWISFGLGGGWADDDFFNGMEPGFGMHLRMGGTTSQRLLVGGEVIGWLAEDSGTRTEVFRGQVQLIGLFYPSDRGGLFVKGGAGFATRTADTELPDSDFTLSLDSEGFGLDAGVGWDLQLSRNFFLTPGVDLIYQFLGEDQSAPVVMITLGATWH
jgi:hypothetical protein